MDEDLIFVYIFVVRGDRVDERFLVNVLRIDVFVFIILVFIKIKSGLDRWNKSVGFFSIFK